MSWLAKLYETYEAVSNNESLNEFIEPYFHKYEQCHIEIILNEKGDFVRAESLVHEVSYGKQSYWKGEETLVPITPKSLTGRTSGPAPYPLAEQIQYVAKDYPDFGGAKESYFKKYSDQLDAWVTSRYRHPKIEAVAKYIAKSTVVRDLIAAKILFVFLDNEGKEVLITNWSKQGDVDEKTKKKRPKPPLLNAVNNNEQGNAKIRWRVQCSGEADDRTWNDSVLIKKWQEFQLNKNKDNGFCQVLGKAAFITTSHPKGIVRSINDAKLISVPTNPTYLTFQGKFIEAEQACALSFEVSQKAHNVLRWLIARGQGHQGYPGSEQIFVTWALSGVPTPEPLEDIWQLMHKELIVTTSTLEDLGVEVDYSVDAGQSFALQLNNYIRGYAADLKPSEFIVVLGMDAATKGRLGITYYQKLLASDFFEKIENWHNQFAWPQRHTVGAGNSSESKKTVVIWPVCSPSPKRIMEAAYGDVLKSNEKLKKLLLQRMVPCIVEGVPFPRDIMLSAVRRVCNRTAKRLPDKFSNYKSEQAEWEKHLGVACALYKGFHLRHPNKSERRTYDMTLEEDRTTRDYLYGRLLAIAEKTEEMAMIVADEKPRSTVASRLMQRFADRPFSTWLNIEKGIVPYQERLKSNIAPLADAYKRLLDDVCDAFDVNEFKSKESLSGEFLLGFHSQRKWFRDFKLEKGKWVRKEKDESTESDKDLTQGERS